MKNCYYRRHVSSSPVIRYQDGISTKTTCKGYIIYGDPQAISIFFFFVELLNIIFLLDASVLLSFVGDEPAERSAAVQLSARRSRV